MQGHYYSGLSNNQRSPDIFSVFQLSFGNACIITSILNFNKTKKPEHWVHLPNLHLIPRKTNPVVDLNLSGLDFPMNRATTFYFGGGGGLLLFNHNSLIYRPSGLACRLWAYPKIPGVPFGSFCVSYR